jgi:hypothetical protein
MVQYADPCNKFLRSRFCSSCSYPGKLTSVSRSEDSHSIYYEIVTNVGVEFNLPPSRFKHLQHLPDVSKDQKVYEPCC